MFDHLTTEKLKFYVYALINPVDNKPFYIGKGYGNRVFNHLKCAVEGDFSNLKLDKIRDIIAGGREVEHLIIRHGLTDKEAFEIEASLIDFGNRFGFEFSNAVLGHHSYGKGLMTSDEVIRLHNALPLTELSDAVIIININRRYFRGNSSQDIYEATKEAWVIGEQRRKTTHFALAEYGGIIIEVFEIEDWYAVDTPTNKRKNRWGFNGCIAAPEIRDKYLNKSVAGFKKQGAANPIRYRL